MEEILYAKKILLTFFENAAELGCPINQEVDMWFRNLSREDSLNVTQKVIKKIEKESKSSRQNKSHKFDVVKKLKENRKGELVLSFGQDDVELLGLQNTNCFEISSVDDFLILKKKALLDIDLGMLPSEHLYYLIQKSCEDGLPVNEVIEEILKDVIESF